MPDSSSPSPRPDQPWHAAPKTPTSRGARLFRCWATTGIAGSLIALYVYLVIPPRIPHTQIVAVTNARYEMGNVPSIPYSLEDVSAMVEVTERPNRKDLELTTDTRLTRDELLAEAAPGPSDRSRGRIRRRFARDDAFLLYVSAHGIARDGIPYLLCGAHFKLPNSAAAPAGGLDVSRLLEQLKQCKRQPKILVLDTGWIVSDPRLGMVFNDFPRLVESKLREIDDPNLWVLLSSSMFETCAVIHSRQRSVFGFCFTEALQGKEAADENGDGLLSLGELYAHLNSCCHGTQRPLLMQGGKGLIAPGDAAQIEEFVVPVTPPVPPEEGARPEAEAPDGNHRQSGTSGDTASLPIGQPISLASAGFSFAMLQAGGQPVEPPTDARTEPKADADRGSRQPQAPAANSPVAGRPDAGANPNPQGAAPATTADTEAAASTTPTQPQEPPTGTTAATVYEAPACLPPDGAAASFLATLNRAWQIRDRLAGLPSQDRRSAGPLSEIRGQWSPVDYAPHLWRKLNKLLLDYERHFRSRAIADIAQEESAGPETLETIVRGLENIEKASRSPAGSAGAPAVGSEVVSALLDAQQHFLQSSSAARAAEGQRLNRLVQTVRCYNDMLFLAPCYVRWRGQAILTCAEPPSDQPDKLIDEFLDCLVTMRDRLAEARASAPEQLREGPLNNAQRELLKSWDELETHLRQARNRDIATVALPASACLLENQLNTLYLSAADRTKMLEAIVCDGGKDMCNTDTRPPPPASAPGAVSLRASGWPSWRWGLLRKQADFEYKLIRLAYGTDSPEARDLVKKLEDLDQLQRLDDGRNPAEIVECYRQIGRDLEKDYAGIASRVASRVDDLVDNRGNDMASFDHELQRWHLQCLEDPRDVDVIRSGNPVDTFAWIDALAEPKIKLTVDPPNQLVLNTKSPKDLTVSVKVSSPRDLNPDATRIVLSFSSDLLEVYRLDGAGEVRIVSGKDAVSLPPDVHNATLKFRVRYLDTRDLTTPLGNLEIVAHGPRPCRDQKSIRCTRNVVDLIVKRIQDDDQRSEQRQHWSKLVELRPFPNRFTEFECELVNRSGELKKNVTVQLYAVRRPTGATWAPGAILRPSRGSRRGLSELLPGIEEAHLLSQGKVKGDLPLVASTAKDSAIELGIEQTSKRIKFVAPEAGAGEEGGPEITNGLLCVIRNEDQDKGIEEEWIKWLEIVPLRPTDFLEASIPSQQPKNGYRIDLSPSKGPAGLRLPADLSDKPLEIRWLLDSRQGDRLPGGLLTVAKSALEQTTRIDLARPSRLPATAWIDVDSYPRTFAYAFFEYADQPRSVTGRRVEIVKLAMGAADKTQSFHPGRSDGRAIFPRTGAPLVVEFAVDVDKGEWLFLQRTGPEATMRIELAYLTDTRRQPIAGPFYADRHVTTRLAKVGPDGQLRIEAKVGDYREAIAAAKLPRGLFRIALTLQGGDGPKAEDEVEVILDDEKPKVTIQSVDVRPLEKKLHVALKVQDPSDIEKIDFQIVREGIATQQPLPPFSLDRDGFSMTSDGGIEVDLALDAKKLPPGTYRMIGSATDRLQNIGSSEPYRFTITRANATGTRKATARKYGIICGRVQIGAHIPDAAERFTVTLENSGLPKTKTREKGRFLFRRVLLGKQYAVTVQGPFLNRMREGHAKDTAPLPKDQPEEADYDLLVIPLKQRK